MLGDVTERQAEAEILDAPLGRNLFGVKGIERQRVVLRQTGFEIRPNRVQSFSHANVEARRVGVAVFEVVLYKEKSRNAHARSELVEYARGSRSRTGKKGRKTIRCAN